VGQASGPALLPWFFMVRFLLLFLPFSLFALPSPFEPNLGQFPSNVLFANRAISLTADGPVFRPGVRLALAGGSFGSPMPAVPLAARTAYILSEAHPVAPHYSEVRYRNVYRGIDLVFHDNEYDFNIAAGADPRAIRLRFPDANRVTIEGGRLLVDGLRHERPLAWQNSGATRHYVGVRYQLQDGEVRFELGRVDPTLPLVIDPVVTWATYAGGAGADTGNAIAIDATGNSYLAGTTNSTDFAAPKGTPAGARGYITKLDPSGANVVATAVIAGATIDGIALGSAGSVTVAGSILSTQFPGPTTGAAQVSSATGYVARFTQDSSGFKLQYIATFAATPSSVALDGPGAIYVTGTAGPAFAATTGVAQGAHGGGTCFNAFTGSGPCPDAFALKLSTDGARVLYATFLGGSAEDAGRAIAVNSGGEAYITGDTASENFPVTPGAAQSKFGGRVPGDAAVYGDAFVAKLNTDASHLVFATYLGGTAPDIAYAVAVDKNGNAFVAGSTQSSDFPVSTGAYQAKYAGGTLPSDAVDPSGDAFVARFTTAGDRVWSTFLGGNDRDIAEGIALDAAGSVFVAGTTQSLDFPFAAGAVRGCLRTGGPYVAELDSAGSKLLRSSSTGGMGFDEPHAIAVTSESAVYIAGDAESRVFFASGGAVQKSYGGGDTDAFAAKLDLAATAQTYVACVLNAASFQPGNFAFFPLGTVAPGEVVSIFGLGLGPDPGVLASVPAGGSYPTTLGGTQVLFDGIAAPMWYVSSTQINAVVPYGVKAPSTRLTVQRGNVTDGPRILPVAAAVPGVFTGGSIPGQGQAAVLNEDGSYNTVANPAARGSTIVFYAVGAGVMTPPEVDGAVQPGVLPLPAPAAPVTVQIRGVEAKVLYAGAAPGYISGLMQINVQVPSSIDFGNSVPLTLSIGGQASQLNVTIAVK
jgi:uncharacterized protein (TIGR03437 family)